MASTSPRRSQSFHDAVDLVALHRELDRREDARRITDAQFTAEKRQIERRAETLQQVLADADDRLARQASAVATVHRESAAASAESTRQLTTRNAASTKLQLEIRNQEQLLGELGCRVGELEAAGASLRLALAQAQLACEERQAQSTAVTRQLSDEAARQHAAGTALEAQRQSHLPERRRLEAKAADMQEQLAAVADATRATQTAIPAAEAKHSEIRAAARRRIDGQREQASDDASVVRSLRALLAELVDGTEEAARRRRRAQEEETKDRVAARRQAAQAHASAVSDLERRLRAKTEALAGELQTEVAHLALEALPQLREELRVAFARELELRDDYGALQRQLVGAEALGERLAVSEDQFNRLGAAIKDLADQCEVAAATLEDRSRRAAALQDAVAPLADVEESCLALAARQREMSKKLSDDAADQALWRVRANDEDQRMNAEILGLQGEVHVLQEKKVADQAANDAAVADLEAEVRRLEADSKSLSSSVEDMAARNKAAEATIEHIARQRRAMAEEMAERRNAARAAAASLLSQLE